MSNYAMSPALVESGDIYVEVYAMKSDDIGTRLAEKNEAPDFYDVWLRPNDWGGQQPCLLRRVGRPVACGRRSESRRAGSSEPWHRRQLGDGMKRRVVVHEPLYSACPATDWVAVCDRTDAQAYGATPEEAIENLYEQEGWNDEDEG